MSIERDKERRAHNVFQNILSCYGFMNDIITLGIHRLWKKDLIKNIPMKYRWLDESVEAFIPKEELTASIKGVGFTDVDLKTYLFGSCTLHFGIKGGKDDH